MKKILLLLLVCSTVQLSGREVFFIPGWYSQWVIYTKHVQQLEKVFPGEKITVCKWDSNRLWQNAKHSASAFVRKFALSLLQRDDTVDITLIGHSLGGRIVLDCAGILAENRKQVRQIILLGTAGKMSEADIRNCQQVSLLPVINICCFDDNMLKLFYRQEGFMPLGLAGLPRKHAHICQYRMEVPATELAISDMTILSRAGTEPFRETAAHLAAKYLLVLTDAVQGRLTEYYLDLPELEKIAAGSAVPNDFLPGFRVSAEIKGWKFARRRFPRRYRISSPAGKFFYYQSETDALRIWQYIQDAADI